MQTACVNVLNESIVEPGEVHDEEFFAEFRVAQEVSELSLFSFRLKQREVNKPFIVESLTTSQHRAPARTRVLREVWRR